MYIEQDAFTPRQLRIMVETTTLSPLEAALYATIQLRDKEITRLEKTISQLESALDIYRGDM